MPAFHRLLARHAGASLARQLALADLLGNRRGVVDEQEGWLVLAPDQRYPVQVLGTRDGAGRWRWGWADPGNGVPGRLLADACALRDQGRALGVTELAAPGFDTRGVPDHALAMVCRGLAGADAWFRAPRGDGTLLVLVRGLPWRVTGRSTAARVVEVLTRAQATYAVDGRELAMSFLSQQGYGLEQQPPGLVARRGEGDVLVLSFDDAGRLAQVGPPEAPRRRWWRFG